MSDRGQRNGSPPSGLERFERLARRLFAVKKRELEKERANFDSAREAEKKRKLRAAANSRRVPMEATETAKLRCSFCGKSADDVTYLLAGGGKPPDVYICDACVNICVAIIEKTKASGSAQNPPA